MATLPAQPWSPLTPHVRVSYLALSHVSKVCMDHGPRSPRLARIRTQLYSAKHDEFTGPCFFAEMFLIIALTSIKRTHGP